jgi:hypothetical protein
MIRITATRMLAAIVLAAAGLIAATGSASADTTLNPPPLSWYTCKDTGSGTVCHGKMTFEHPGELQGTCPQGFNLLSSAHHDETAARYYDRDGNLIQRVLHDVWHAGDPLNILYNSQTGKSVAYSADTTETDDFAVPGDFGSVTARFTGKIVSVTLPGGGLVVHDVGVFTFAPHDVILEDHGPKMVFFGQTDELCAALA